ncbi:peptidoglycan glycosyltransferase [Pendulispora brunnea]|uniref:Peptidoglycan glycosyltransferase n=1 Tax=Pendulispora brunnea TaxID=2905690 RepID=A0ABZ2K182_9BACT
MKNLDPSRARWIRLRMGILVGVMSLALGGLVAGAYRVQVEDGPLWKDMAEKQRQRRLHIEPKRGTIYDRNGTALAVSVEVPSLSADVGEMLRGIEAPDAQDAILRDVATRLSPGLNMKGDELYAKLSAKKRFVWIKRRITGDEALFVRELSDAKKQPHPIKGLNVEGEGHRYYPGRELAGPVLGFVAPDGQGKDGLELSMDEELRGRVEEVSGLRDRTGRLIFSNGNTQGDALTGRDIHLTIDEGIQHVAERELNAAQRTYEAKGGALVVVDPNTGEILALASSPGYNPNDYGESEVDARRDRAVTDRFEPGSVMKVFTFAGALAAGTLKPTESIFCEHGSYTIAGAVIRDTHLNDWLTPTQILARSSNIGALKIGLNLGEAGLYSTFRRFGFGEPTGLPLPGEASGVLRPRGRAWFEVDTAYASFGQGVSTTTVQLAMAMAAIANGGRLLEPVLVRKVMDSRGELVREGVTHVRREVIPPGTARMVTEMLTAVTEDGGTALEASIPGFRVAGKTGTAQKADTKTGKMSNELFTSSFVGFVPAERPRLVIAVMLDEPVIGHAAGSIAGPVFRRTAEATLRYLGVTPNAATAKLSNVTREGDPADSFIASMKPPQVSPPDPAPAPDGIAQNREREGEREQQPMIGPPQEPVRVPDTNGLAARDAVKSILAAGLVPQIEGYGRLVRQSPTAGSSAAKGSAVRLVFEPSS